MSDKEEKLWVGPQKRWVPIVVLAVCTLGAIALTWLLMTVFDHKQEAKHPFTQVVEMNEETYDPAVWGQNFPIQYEQYKKTSEMPADEQVKHEPTATDPRTVVAKSKIEADPRLVTMWQGYAFSVDYREPRGHEYMLEDQQYTRRMTEFKQPGACLNCHVSLPQTVNELGNGDAAAGWAAMNKLPYAEAAKSAHGPIGCIDCHDPETMALRVTRPAFVEGIKSFKASQGIQNYDVNKDATAQEMRTFVCAQCHVEYYFKGEEKTLTFPWKNGLTVNDAMNYYDEIGFKDFEHKLTGAPALKAQHPDFETWSNGIHAQNGVTCADCHMPYERNGAAKTSNHQVASPMRSEETINSTCLTCHHSSAEEMKGRVEGIHDRWESSKNLSFDALDDLIKALEQAKKDGAVPEDRLNEARQYQRYAEFIIDYNVSENSRGFHAPAYSISTLNQATDYAMKGRLVLLGVTFDEKAGPGPVSSSTASPR